MNRQNWEKIQELLMKVLEVPAEEQREYLGEICGTETSLRDEVWSLLMVDDNPVRTIEGALSDILGRGSLVGRTIGPYRLLRELGRGGMGVVYLALRVDGLHRREVAIKVLQQHRKTREFLRRFQDEQQTLATLNHPNIVTLHDAGTMESGVPYFVMEYVLGFPITEYCDRKRLAIPERLKLFQKVCQAVQVAHQHAVVHRDIKPSNILVTEQGEPKLLDFGISKLLVPDTAGSATKTGSPLMTRAYASPEQLRGDTLSLTSDVYSLGVVLYELLTGHRVCRPASDAERRFHQIEVEKPSLVISLVEKRRTEGGEAVAVDRGVVSEERSCDPKELQRQLSGDLDTIVLMSLHEEPERRYASAFELSADIERHYDGLPVFAQRDSFTYRAGKFIRRNRLIVGVGAVLTLLIIGFVAALVIEQRETASERDKARRVAEFLVELFEVADPSRSRGETITAREVLDNGSERIQVERSLEPEVRAMLLHTIGRVYRGIGLYEESEGNLRSAMEIRRKWQDADLSGTLKELAWVLRLEGHTEDAEALAREAVDIRLKLLGAHHPEFADALNILALILQAKGEYEVAESLHREALKIRRNTLPSQSYEVAESMHDLAIALRNQAEYAAADPLFREALAIMRVVLADSHPDIARCMRSLGYNLYLKGDHGEAEPVLREVLERTQRVLGEKHPEVGTDMHHFARVLEARGDLQGAAKLYRGARDISRDSLGEDHPNVGRANLALATVLRKAGEAREAEAYCREAIEVLRGALGEEHPHYTIALSHLSEILSELGRLAEAEQVLREAEEKTRSLLGAEHPHAVALLLNLAALLRDKGDYSEAETLYYEALRLRREKLGDDHQEVAKVLSGLAILLNMQERFEEALATAEEAIEIFGRTFEGEHWWKSHTETVLGATLTALGQYEKAEALLLAGYPVVRSSLGSRAKVTRQALGRILTLYESWGKPDEAASYRSQLMDPVRESETGG